MFMKERSAVLKHGLLLFLLAAALVFFLWRRSARKREDPEFKGPVYTVDYEEVEDEEE